MSEMRVMGSKTILEKALVNVPRELIPEGIRGGDTKLIWDKSNADEVENAKRTFDDLKKKGFAAFKVVGEGAKGEQLFSFDSNAERIIMVPQMRGG
jgi:hypothetical protein